MYSGAVCTGLDLLPCFPYYKTCLILNFSAKNTPCLIFGPCLIFFTAYLRLTSIFIHTQPDHLLQGYCGTPPDFEQHPLFLLHIFLQAMSYISQIWENWGMSYIRAMSYISQIWENRGMSYIRTMSYKGGNTRS